MMGDSLASAADSTGAEACYPKHTFGVFVERRGIGAIRGWGHLRLPGCGRSGTYAWVMQERRGGSAMCYGGRWTIEETFHTTKQHLGGEDPQSWVEPAPERAVMGAFLTYGLVWVWYLLTQGDHPRMIARPWYPTKTTPSFLDAIAALRTVVWTDRIYDETGRRPLSSKMAAELIQVLAEAG